MEQLDLWTEFLVGLGIRSVNYEPVIICGRAKKDHIKNVSEEAFVSNYIKAKKLGRKLGIDVTYSGIKQDKKTLFHCGAYGRNFVICPDGTISTCYEVTKHSCDNTDKFIIGETFNNTVYIDKDRVKDIRQFANDKRMECSGCFSEYNCSGGCLSKRVVQDNTVIESNNIKCKITNRILLYETLESIGKELNKK